MSPFSTLARWASGLFALVVIALLSALSAFPSVAQTDQKTLRVDTWAVAPFAMEHDGTRTGFSIDLWEEIAGRLKARTVYRTVAGVQAAYDDLQSGSADALVSGIYITSERDRLFDFSYAFLEAGQQIMVRNTDVGGTPNPALDLFDLLASRTTLAWLALAALIIIVPAHLIWLFERGGEDSIVPTAKYFPGIFHALHWCASALLSQAEQTPRRPMARIISFLWMFTGVVFIALYTAQLTANLTVAEFRGAINGPEDLPGKKVGTIVNTLSAEYLRDHNADVTEYPGVSEMFQALLDRKVDALLLPSPVLRYYAAHDGKGRVRMVGPEFHKGQAGFMFPLNSPLRRQVNGVLLKMFEDGTYQRIYDKWFGSE